MFNNKKLVTKNTELGRKTNTPPTQHATQTKRYTNSKILFRNRTWFTMTDLSRLHVALISWSATEKSRSDGML